MKNSSLINPKKDSNYNCLSLTKKTICVFFLISIMLVLHSPKNVSAQDCSLTLSAKNNIESVNDEGRIYFISLQNNSSETISVDLSVVNYNSDENPDESSSSGNVPLNAEVLNSSGKALFGKINLLPKEPLEFQVKVSVPEGTPINHWNHLLLKAISDKCSGYSSSLILYTYIPNPEEK